MLDTIQKSSIHHFSFFSKSEWSFLHSGNGHVHIPSKKTKTIIRQTRKEKHDPFFPSNACHEGLIQTVIKSFKFSLTFLSAISGGFDFISRPDTCEQI